VLQRIIAGAAIDKAVDIDVLREGKNQRLTVVIENSLRLWRAVCTA